MLMSRLFLQPRHLLGLPHTHHTMLVCQLIPPLLPFMDTEAGAPPLTFTRLKHILELQLRILHMEAMAIRWHQLTSSLTTDRHDWPSDMVTTDIMTQWKCLVRWFVITNLNGSVICVLILNSDLSFCSLLRQVQLVCLMLMKLGSTRWL